MWLLKRSLILTLWGTLYGHQNLLFFNTLIKIMAGAKTIKKNVLLALKFKNNKNVIMLVLDSDEVDSCSNKELLIPHQLLSSPHSEVRMVFLGSDNFHRISHCSTPMTSKTSVFFSALPTTPSCRVHRHGGLLLRVGLLHQLNRFL